MSANPVILTHLHADLSDGPGGVITHGDELGVQIRPQDRHELGYTYKTLFNI